MSAVVAQPHDGEVPFGDWESRDMFTSAPPHGQRHARHPSGYSEGYSSQALSTPPMSKGSSSSQSSFSTPSWGDSPSYPSLHPGVNGLGLETADVASGLGGGMKRLVIDTDFSNDKEGDDEGCGFPLEMFASRSMAYSQPFHAHHTQDGRIDSDEEYDRYAREREPELLSAQTVNGSSEADLPGRMGDFQTDNLLNAPQPHTVKANANNPVVMRYHDEAVAPLSLNHGHREIPDRCPTPIYQHPAAGWNLFGNGLGGWDRESWARRKVAFVTGITGQDGSYLAELLLSKGYVVHGLIRRSSSFNTSRLQHLWRDRHSKVPNRLFLHYGDLTDSANLVGVIAKTQPSEVYNLAAQSHVKVSFEMAEYTGDVDGIGTLRLLEAIRTCGLEKLTKFYQASTSELYGQVRSTPQNEVTPFHPRSPYGVAKLYAYWMCVNYREAYGMFTSNGILFNHESPRRGRTFVSRKITRAVAEIYLGKQDCMWMGNLDAKRDWGHARDYVEGMWRMLQHDKPDDFVLATGETHTVRSLITLSFSVLSIPLRWEGSGLSEIALRLDTSPPRVVVRIDSRYFRPSEVDLLLGDPGKAERELGWKRRTGWEELVRDMVESDVRSARGLVEDCN